MELYTFRYPPRPTPSQAHRPTRYYFHNLDQDAQLVRKSAPLGTSFQKEGVPPTIATKASMNTDTALAVRIKSASSFLGDEGVRSEEEVGALMESDGARMGNGLKVLDRTKFLVD
ncbi:hypothetical protein EC991_002542 [Linnemannia zychae]|nr:hypothetical protein EC991_002542 [Linnemannia zychae]